MSVKISQLPSATAVTSNDLVPIVDSGSLTTQKATAQQFLDYVTGSTIDNLNVTNLTASVSGSFIGDGSELNNLQINTSGNITGSGELINPVTLKDDIVLNSISASQITSSQFLGNNYTVLSGNVVFEGNSSASFGDYAYIDYDESIDRMVIFPGLFVTGSNGLTVSGSITASNSITASSAYFSVITASAISASTYLGISNSSVELTKLINVTSSVTLLTTQRAVFATNVASSSISITLPSASLADSREYSVIKSDSLSGSVFVSASSPNLINGQSTFELNGPYQAITLIHDETNWYVF
jgi:hypothetical protein